MSDKIILFGCGAYGRQVYAELNDKIVYAFDNDKSKWGKKIGDLIIQSPNELKTLKEEIDNFYTVLVTAPSKYVLEISNQINGLGINCKVNDARDFIKEDCRIKMEKLVEVSELIEGVENKSDANRYINIKQLLESTLSIDGHVVECGVYKADSALVIDKICVNTNKKVYLMDTFEGMPETDSNKDLHRKGDFNDTSLEYVKNKLDKYSNLNIYYKGLFSKNLLKLANEKFSFVHIDCDIYSAIKECCEFFYDKVNKFGIILFDDFGFYSCPGARDAVCEFLEDKPEKLIILESGQAFIIKR